MAATAGFLGRSHAEERRASEYFRREVVPVVARDCSSRAEQGPQCHGRLLLEGEEPAAPHPVPAAAEAKVTGGCSTACHESGGRAGAVLSFRPDGAPDEAGIPGAYAWFLKRVDLTAPAPFSTLLRKPRGELSHPGGQVFDRPDHPGLRVLRTWAELELAARGRAPERVTPAEAFFGERVLPVLAHNGCMSPSCHTFNHSSFLPDPGLAPEDPAGPRFSPEMVRQNRRAALGLIQKLAHLDGDVAASRFLKKCLPLSAGGVLHRGGNDQFLDGLEDPDYATLREWLLLERRQAAARVGVPETDLGRVQGLIFLRLPRDAHRPFLDVGRYVPGGDLYLLKLRPGETPATATGTPVNLTARFHPEGPADLREPEVRFDGRRVMFAMRRGEEDRLNLYEIALDDGLAYVEGSFRRLTYGPRDVNGLPVHFTDPLYVPDSTDEGADRGGVHLDRADIAFSASLAGRLVASTPRGVLGEADGGDRGAVLDLDRPEPDGAFRGRRIFFLDGTNAGEWRRVADSRRGTPSRLVLDRPLPRAVDRTTVYALEPVGPPTWLPGFSVYGMRAAAPGRERETYERTVNRITWGLGHDMDLSLRSTGEVFFGSLRSGGDLRGRPVFNFSSNRIHLDNGFSFPTHHGNRAEELIYADNHELPDGTDIHAGLGPESLWEGGNLIVSDHQFGPGLEERNPVDYSTGDDPSHPRPVFKKFTLFPVTGPRAVTREGISPGGLYRDPSPLPDGALLVSHAGGPIRHEDPSARPDFDLFVVRAGHPPLGRGNPEVRLQRVAAASTAEWSEVQACLVRVRLKPKIRAASKPVEDRLIRDEGAGADGRPARYFERNYLLIDAIQYDPTPTGKHVLYEREPVTGEAVPEDRRVRYVRLVEGLPLGPADVDVDPSRVGNGDPLATRASCGIHPSRRVLAEIPVEADGSVLALVPSRTPFVFQSLDAERMALRTTNRWFFFVPNQNYTLSPPRGETFQQCGACMGGMSGRQKDVYGPSNPVPGLGKVQAEGQQEVPLYGQERLGVDFRRDVQPILDRGCVRCHGAGAALRLTGEPTAYYTVAYESLHALEDPASGWYGRKRYVDERNGLARGSYLIEKLTGRELDAPRRLSGSTPHAVSPEDLRTLVRWIDLGATFR